EMIKLREAKLVFVDTLAASIPGANENAPEDMGAFLGKARWIKEETGAVIVLVHHTGKDTTKGARGWSGLKAAVDFEVEVIRHAEDKAVSLVNLTKQKDETDDMQLAFKLEVVQLGFNSRGRPITSCV